jgi:hypothetical protein
MKTIFKTFFSLIAIVAFSFSNFAQEFSVGSNMASESYGQIPLTEGGGTTITHSVDPVTISDTSLACIGDSANSDNQLWRSFILADFGITDFFDVTMVEIGISEAAAGGGGMQPMTVNLFTTDLIFPTGTLTLIGTLDVMVPDQYHTLYQIPVTGTAPPGSELVVEISIPEATAGSGRIFLLGANNLGQTADSWISSAGCGVTTPVTTATLGFPFVMWVMSVTGDETVPVELTSFTVNINTLGDVVLSWSTATEINNQMFEIERRNLVGEYTTIGYVEGFGTTTEPQRYSYTDNNVGTGTYFYRLKQIDFGGQYEYSDEIEVEVNSPLTFALEQNYPNPFNPSTIIKYSIPENGFVKLSVYNLVGEEVSVLVNETVEAGFYDVSFNAANLPSGTYFYRLQSSNTVQIKKMVLLK